MSKTRKFGEKFAKARNKARNKRKKAKGALKELPDKFKVEEDPYNSLEIDYYEEGNFEKFDKRRWLEGKYL